MIYSADLLCSGRKDLLCWIFHARRYLFNQRFGALSRDISSKSRDPKIKICTKMNSPEYQKNGRKSTKNSTWSGKTSYRKITWNSPNQSQKKFQITTEIQLENWRKNTEILFKKISDDKATILASKYWPIDGGGFHLAAVKRITIRGQWLLSYSRESLSPGNWALPVNRKILLCVLAWFSRRSEQSAASRQLVDTVRR